MDRELVERAIAAASRAYAPYPRFLRRRAAHGQRYRGRGQQPQNASFPAGICAERTALHHAMAMDPKGVVRCIAVAVPQVKGDAPFRRSGSAGRPCWSKKRGKAPRCACSPPHHPARRSRRAAADLLPLHFDASFLTK